MAAAAELVLGGGGAPADVDIVVATPGSGPGTGSLFKAALRRFPSVKDAAGNILTDRFLDICMLTLPAIDSFGTAFSIVHSDIANNVERIRRRQSTDPGRFRLLYEVVLDEVARSEDAHPQSCTKAVLWLKRGMEFMLAIMAALLDDPTAAMSDIVYDRYHATIHRWHGFLCSSAFSVAFAFVPSRDVFLSRIGGGTFDAAAEADMAAFVAKFSVLLGEVHCFLDKHGLDDPRRV